MTSKEALTDASHEDMLEHLEQRVDMEIEGRVSVIMGIYNCAQTLPRAIESIIAQTYTNWELIMCDDCSTDNTKAIARTYACSDPERIKLISNKQNMHLAYTLNHCLEHVTGQYVARMDGDDISLPERFARQVKYLQAHPEVQLVGTAMQQFNDEHGTLRVIYKPEHTNKWTLHKENPFNHATIMTYKHVYDELEGYTVAKRTIRCEDNDLWFRFFAAGYAGDNLQEPLYMVREDMHAIKRRTVLSRMRAFQTACYGHRLLGYPKVWLVGDFVKVVVKSLTPNWAWYLYRLIQQRLG